MKQFCENSILKLKSCSIDEWAELFVLLKMEFFKKYQRGIICSSAHGTEWFQNILDCLNGKEWDKKEHKGEYEDNFRKLVEIGRKET